MICSKCLYPESHPFGMSFNKYKNCCGCITHNEKYVINWNERREILTDKLNKLKKSSVYYDCVVPVIGDAEDYHVMSIVLEMGLKPLVVCVNDYFLNDIGWHNLHNLITFFDVDSLVYNPDINIYKELVSTSLRKYNHGMWPSISIRSSFPIHIAKQRKIPLVIYGQNQSIEQVGKFSHYDEVQGSHWSRVEHDLFGVTLGKMCGSGSQIDPNQISYYKYPDLKKLGKGFVVGLYLSNYFFWDPLYQNSKTIDYNFISQNQNNTFDPYERAGSSMYYGFHDLSKQLRCGYRKIQDHVTREIRHNRVKTLDGVRIVKQYSKNKIYIKDFFDWLGVNSSGYKWFVEHRLSEVAHLISTKPILSSPKIKLPKEISKLVHEKSEPKKEFQGFLKGISL
jgi:hypothetical protein